MTTRILRVDTSARGPQSVSARLLDEIVARLENAGNTTLVRRDVSDGLPPVNPNWVAAAYAAPDARGAEEAETLALSDELIAEVREADVLAIGLPVYNFNLPSTLKAWIDQIARAGVTFRYTEDGPEGLLKGKRAIVAMASAGTPLGAEHDFVSGYLRFVLGFLGIDDVEFVSFTGLEPSDETVRDAAAEQLDALPLAA